MSKNKDNCPTLSELQDFSYGSQDSSIEEHLRICDKCRKEVEKEKALNALLDQYMTPPAGLNGRILQACKDAKEEDEFLMPSMAAQSRPSRRTHYRAWCSYASAAALLVIGVIIGVLIPVSTDYSIKTATPMTAEAVAEQNADAMPVNSVAFAPPAAAPAPRMMAKAFSPVPEESLEPQPVMLADASEGFSLKDSLAVSNGRTVPQEVTTVSLRNTALHGNHKAKLNPVGEEVTHVWLADSMPSDAELQSIAKLNNGTICVPSAVDDNGVMTISLSATDQDVQRIADKLYGDNHWKLLSPASPQPCLAKRTPLNGHAVKYNIKVVPNN